MLAAADDAQETSLQAGFKVLRQVLLQLKLGFNVQTLDKLVTIEIVDVVVLEVEAKHEADQRDEGDKDLTTHEGNVVRVSSIIVEETKAIEATPVVQDIEVVEVAPTVEDTEVAEMVPAEEDAKLAETSPKEVPS